jgi:hypothetical protein
MKKKVEGHLNLYKDIESGVIVNRETTERQKYRHSKRLALDNLNSKSQLDEVKAEMNEIKALLKELTNK